MRSIGAKFAITVGALAVAFSALVLCHAWYSSSIYLAETTSRKAELALEFDLAIRKYVAQVVRPEMQRRLGEGEFIPETMSTSFVARSVFDEVRKKYPEYVLKFSSDDPRNPANKAGPAEMEILQRFRKNPELARWAGNIEIDGKQYVAHFSPRRVKESCLRCHGRPEDAPPSLLERYGSEAGFHRSVGDTIAMDTVAIPTDHVRDALASQFGRQLLTMGLWLALLFGAILIVFRWTVGRRLAAIARHFAQRAQDEEGAPFAAIPVSGRDEISALVSAYNQLAANVRALHASLERRVEERTRKLEAEVAQRRQAEERFRLAAHLASDLIYEWTVADDSLQWFGDVDAALGRDPGEVPRTIEGWGKLVHPDDQSRLRQAVEHHRESPEPIDSQYRVQRKDGTWSYWIDRATPLLDDQGVPYQWIGVCTEVTERKQAQEQLEDYTLALESQKLAVEELYYAAQTANRAKSEFLANMSHEIRTPMTAILGFADLLLDRLEEPGNVEAATTIKRNGEHLLRIINDVLDLSKVEAGKIEAERTECSPWQIVEEVVSSMRVQAESKGLRLEMSCHWPLPQVIQTDPVRLRQILVNLIGNAIKFTERGTVRISLRCNGDPEAGPRVHFAVTDTGIGMAAAQIRRLFQPFSQADTSTTRRFGGSGLGLIISKRLAEMLWGDIQVVSRPGKGSTFTLTIDPGSLEGVPMLDAPPNASTGREKPAARGSTEKLYGRVLLAEDGPDNQRLIRFLLTKAGLEVDLAENGQIACDKALASEAEGRPYDLIVMDMQMPEMDGYTATGHLREHGWRRPIVALTAHAMEGDRERCLEAGCDDYAGKPIDRATLLRVAAKHIPRQPQEPEIALAGTCENGRQMRRRSSAPEANPTELPFEWRGQP